MTKGSRTSQAFFRHVGVPYVSQWSDPRFACRIVQELEDPCADPRWRESGFDDPDAYRFWSRRTCGLACLRSVLAYWYPDATWSLAALVQQALQREVYRIEPGGGLGGLFYAAFSAWVGSQFGLAVGVEADCKLDVLAAHVDSDSMAIASVSSEIRYPWRANCRRGGHLVLLHGRDRDRIWFHNPSGTHATQADVCLDKATFARFFAGRGMSVRRRCAA